MGGWTRLLIWCAVIMSACGFTWVYLTIITAILLGFGWLSPRAGEVMFSLGYLIIIGPVIGSGFGIWIHSLVQAYKTKRFGDVAVAGWNTFAQVHNIYNAAKEVPSAWKSVVDGLKGDSDDTKGVAILLIVILAVAGGALTTAGIARRADRTHVINFSRSMKNLNKKSRDSY
ncbi:MAG: hypothetical protein Q8Q04_01010 [archaeon]|nr:hypothetical protein [archaeon]